jgi:SMODS and SLOG-associating 2TM effector domain
VDIQEKPAYLLTVILLVLIGAALIAAILALRPASDPLVVLGGVGGFVGSIGAGVLSYMKSEETHNLVNSRMDEWMEARDRIAHAEGLAKGQALAEVKAKSEVAS